MPSPESLQCGNGSQFSYAIRWDRCSSFGPDVHYLMRQKQESHSAQLLDFSEYSKGTDCGYTLLSHSGKLRHWSLIVPSGAIS
jgi:hypothetical protein